MGELSFTSSRRTRSLVKAQSGEIGSVSQAITTRLCTSGSRSQSSVAFTSTAPVPLSTRNRPPSFPDVISYTRLAAAVPARSSSLARNTATVAPRAASSLIDTWCTSSEKRG